MVLLDIPHPSLKEAIISGEIYFALRGLVILARFLESEVARERRRIIKHHSRHHSEPFKYCLDDDCAILAIQTDYQLQQESEQLLLS